MDGPQGHRDRLRQRFLLGGLVGFAPHEVLELLLFFAIPRIDTKPIAKALLKHFGSLYRVLEATPEELVKVKGIGPSAAALLSLQTALYRAYEMDRWGAKPDLSSRTAAGRFCAALFIGKRYEEMKLLALNASYQLLHEQTIMTGTIDQVPVYERLVVEFALRHQATFILMAHNHPGGSSAPSPADIVITEQMSGVLSSVGVRLLDHLIIVGDTWVSIGDTVESDATRSALRLHKDDRAAEPK